MTACCGYPAEKGSEMTIMPQAIVAALNLEKLIAGMEPTPPDVRLLKEAVEVICRFYNRAISLELDVLPSNIYLRSRRGLSYSNVKVLDDSYIDYRQCCADRYEHLYECFTDAAFGIAGIAFKPSQVARGFERQASACAAAGIKMADTETRVYLKYLIEKEDP